MLSAYKRYTHTCISYSNISIFHFCNEERQRMGDIKRTESSEETESTTTASRRDSEDSDSGVNMSEREGLTNQTPGRRMIFLLPFMVNNIPFYGSKCGLFPLLATLVEILLTNEDCSAQTSPGDDSSFFPWFRSSKSRN